MNVLGKRTSFAHLKCFSVLAFVVLSHLKTILWAKSFCQPLRYLSLFAYTHAKFGRVEALLSKLFKDSYLKVLLHSVTLAVTEGGD